MYVKTSGVMLGVVTLVHRIFMYVLYFTKRQINLKIIVSFYFSKSFYSIIQFFFCYIV